MSSADSGSSTGLAAEWRARLSRLFVERRVHRPVAAPRMTLTVVAYRSDPGALRQALESMERAAQRADAPIERMVADCGHNEPCQKVIEELSDTQLVLLPDCTLNEARNAILAWSDGEIVMLADDDGLLEDDAVANMLRHFEGPDIVAVRGRIRAKARRYLTTLASHYDRGDRVVDDALFVEGHMAVRRDNALRVGGFDERMFGGEGLLFSYRLLHENPGMRIVYAPDVVMRHDFYHDFRHFVRKSAGFANQHEMLLELFGDQPGFPEFLREKTGKKHERSRLSPDEWVASQGLKLARTTIKLWTRIRERGRAHGGVKASLR